MTEVHDPKARIQLLESEQMEGGKQANGFLGISETLNSHREKEESCMRGEKNGEGAYLAVVHFR